MREGIRRDKAKAAAAGASGFSSSSSSSTASEEAAPSIPKRSFKALFRSRVAALVTAALFVTLYRMYSASPIKPVAVSLPPLQSYPRDNRLTPGHVGTDGVAVRHLWTTAADAPKSKPPTLWGPESLLVDPQDHSIITGLHDGRIVRLPPLSRAMLDGAEPLPPPSLIARTGADVPGCGSRTQEPVCGRPLGLVWDPWQSEPYSHLIVADGYLGLLRVRVSDGTVVSLATHSEDPGEVPGKPLRRRLNFPNALDVDPATGDIYFTDTSARWQRRDIPLDVLEGLDTGRLLVMRRGSRKVVTVASNIAVANGVCITHDGTAVLVASTSHYKVHAYHIKGPKAGTLTVFADGFPGTPDNIRRSSRGTYWMALGTKRMAPFALTQLLAPYPWARRMLASLLSPWTIVKLIPKCGLVVEVDASGAIVGVSQDPTGKSHSLSEAEEVPVFNGAGGSGGVNATVLMVGSYTNKFLVAAPLPAQAGSGDHSGGGGDEVGEQEL